MPLLFQLAEFAALGRHDLGLKGVGSPSGIQFLLLRPPDAQKQIKQDRAIVSKALQRGSTSTGASGFLVRLTFTDIFFLMLSFVLYTTSFCFSFFYEQGVGGISWGQTQKLLYDDARLAES